MPRFWIAVASYDHVIKGVAEGFALVCHGKPGPLKRMAKGDWIVYYSPTAKFKEAVPFRCFTAIGRISTDELYAFTMHEDFVPWRRDVAFLPAQTTPIEPLLDSFSFVRDRRHWGLPFRSGFFEIAEADFQVIARAMGVRVD